MTNFDSYYEPPSFDEYCVVCGDDLDNCCCPECPECGEAGNPDCYTKHGMVLNEAQIKAQAITKARMDAERLADDTYAKSMEEDERLRQEHPELWDRQYHTNCYHCHSEKILEEK